MYIITNIHDKSHDNTIKNSANYDIFIKTARIRGLTYCNSAINVPHNFGSHEHRLLMYNSTKASIQLS